MNYDLFAMCFLVSLVVISLCTTPKFFFQMIRVGDVPGVLGYPVLFLNIVIAAASFYFGANFLTQYANGF